LAVLAVVDPERGVIALLDDVATALIGAGYADPFSTTPAMRLRCLFAAGRLEALGARPDRTTATTVCREHLNGMVVVGLVVTMLLETSLPIEDLSLAEARKALHEALSEG
jgi:hypothetical protein